MEVSVPQASTGARVGEYEAQEALCRIHVRQCGVEGGVIKELSNACITTFSGGASVQAEVLDPSVVLVG